MWKLLKALCCWATVNLLGWPLDDLLVFDLASYQDNEVNFLCDKRFIKFFWSSYAQKLKHGFSYWLTHKIDCPNLDLGIQLLQSSWLICASKFYYFMKSTFSIFKDQSNLFDWVPDGPVQQINWEKICVKTQLNLVWIWLAC